MVSYFVPRGRFLIKAGHLRQVHQRHQQQQQQQEKWSLLRQFRRSLSSNKSNESIAVKTKESADISKAETVCRQPSFIKSNGVTAADGKTIARRGFYTKTRTGWTKWTGFLLRWAPIGFCFFGAIEWQLHKRKSQRDQSPCTASEFQSTIYRCLPLRLISRCWGWLAACYVPISLRPYIYGWYSNVFDVNLDEALYPDYKHYNSLAEFFTRPLRDGVRMIDQHAPLVSPADGKVLHFGSATNSLIEQVKGVNYSIESFLGPPTWRQDARLATNHDAAEYAEVIKEKHDGSTTLYQCVIYLAPGDYHRFHSPAEWVPTVRRHFSGELLSVSPKVANWLPGLFCLNERALYLGSWPYGFFSYTAVGATNVGSVQIYMDEELKTNRWIGLKVGTHKKHEEYDELRFNDEKPMAKGDLVGQFNMGSTIVLLFEAPKNFNFTIEQGQKIRVGESLGSWSNNK